jgi:hypothetical protein
MVADARPCIGNASSKSQKRVVLNRQRMDAVIAGGSGQVFYDGISGYATARES